MLHHLITVSLGSFILSDTFLFSPDKLNLISYFSNSRGSANGYISHSLSIGET